MLKILNYTLCKYEMDFVVSLKLIEIIYFVKNPVFLASRKRLCLHSIHSSYTCVQILCKLLTIQKLFSRECKET